MKRLLLLACGVLMMGGCFTTGEVFRARGLDRAAFEMNCPVSQIRYRGLGCSLSDVIEVCQQVGVQGCGKKVVYIYVRDNWILNSVNGTPQQSQPKSPGSI